MTENPVLLTRSVRDLFTRVTLGGAPAYVWPGGGITVMADVTRMPENSFGSVPTPALVAPIEFSMTRETYLALGGHEEAIQAIEAIAPADGARLLPGSADNPWPLDPQTGAASAGPTEG